MTMTRTQIYLTAEQHQHAQEVAAAQGKTMAEVIREAIAAYIVAQTGDEDPLQEIVGLGASGVGDGARQHDRDLYGGA
jgi:hypothetical protein